LMLLWNAGTRIFRPANEPGWSLLRMIAGEQPAADGVQLSLIELSSELRRSDLRSSNFVGSSLSGVSFDWAKLSGARFEDSLLDTVSFRCADLRGTTFNKAILSDVAVTGAFLETADFRGVDSEIAIIVDDDPQSRRRLTGENALGYLRYHGAITKDLDAINVLRHAPVFQIVEKIAGKLLERSPRQRLGLEQRGIASQNPKFARAFVQLLETEGYVVAPSGRSEVVEITPAGRAILGGIASGRELAKPIELLITSEH
jgi:hypothetical protein